MSGDGFTIGRPTTGKKIVAVVFSIGKNRNRLVVLRPDTELIGYKTNGRTPELALARARADEVNVSDMHAMKDFPRWASRRFFRIFGWQMNWHFHGWCLVRPPKPERAPAEEVAA